jgi:predicted transcriptional regulator
VAVREDCEVALLPIKPRYVAAILNGAKRVEFRRQAFARPISHVLIYATSPVQRVVGYFQIATITKNTPAKIWKAYRDIGGVSADEFAAYYDGANWAVAIEVQNLVILARPMRLDEIQTRLRAPQNYTYLSRDVMRRMPIGLRSPAAMAGA